MEALLTDMIWHNTLLGYLVIVVTCGMVFAGTIMYISTATPRRPTAGTWLALVTLGLGLLAPAVDAGPRTSRTATPGLLTQQERVCQEMGMMAETVAAARDRQVPYLTTLSVLRDQSRKGHWEPPFEANLTHVIREIYASTSLSPALVRQAIELGCLRGVGGH
jgi:hypothetical protein